MRRLAALLLMLVMAAAGRAQAAPVVSPHATTELVAQTDGAAPGSTLWVAVVLTAQSGWHTYWRNPGDAGEATKIAWTLPSGWRAGEILWPAPQRLPVGPIMNYGYEGRVLLPTPIEIPADATPGRTAHIGAAVDYLVCAQVCVPGSAKVLLDVPISAGAPPMDAAWGKSIGDTLAAAPKPAGLTAAFQSLPGRLTLAVTGSALWGARPSDVYFYPYADNLIDQAKPQATERGPKGLTLALVPGAAFSATAAPPAMVKGVLAVDGKVFELDAPRGTAPAGAAGLGPVKPGNKGGDLRLPGALALAFLGGLILNLMPCVFPILSMKAAALARHGGAARAQGAAFLVGVLVAFLCLAAALIAARAAGQAVGWGFQLQSPVVVAALALIMLATALNLSGLYEVGTSVQRIGAGMAPSSEIAGSFLTGVLAVVVAAPCTAPFMGPALGFALTQPAAAALAVFAALGLGFAAPFTVLAFSPALTRVLPKPGAWMDGLRHFLAFPMYGAAAWLAWVLSLQAGANGLARILAAGVALAFAAWLFGVDQRRRAVGRGHILARFCASLSAICAVAFIAAAPFGSAPISAPSGAEVTAEALASQPWSPQKLADLRAARTPVLVNFTAAWCVTCQVNERVAFSTPEVGAAFRRAGAVYLVADWTNRNPAIAKALSDQGRIGVPLYLYYAPGAASPVVLPQILTPAILTDALKS